MRDGAASVWIDVGSGGRLVADRRIPTRALVAAIEADAHIELQGA
jgi:hypothetical protein